MRRKMVVALPFLKRLCSFAQLQCLLPKQMRKRKPEVTGSFILKAIVGTWVAQWGGAFSIQMSASGSRKQLRFQPMAMKTARRLGFLWVAGTGKANAASSYFHSLVRSSQLGKPPQRTLNVPRVGVVASTRAGTMTGTRSNPAARAEQTS
jgi:hypothetical protein